MRVLVTGGAGFIGSHYARALLAGSPAEHRVTVLDALTYAGNPANLPLGHPRLTLVKGDVCDADLLAEVLPGHDAVVHFAAESHVDRSLAEAAPFLRTNITGTHVLLAACAQAGVRRIVHISTDEVYGSIAEGSWTERHPLAPSSPYAASKAGGDLIACAYAHTYRLDLSIVRCSNNYGPRQHPEKLVPLCVTNLLDGLDIGLYGDGRQVRQWLHVADCCRGIQLVLDRGRPGEIYHVGGRDEPTNREVAGRLAGLCGAGPERIRHVADRPGHDRRYSLDSGKIARELGWAPRIPFVDGLAATVAWYRDHRSWWEPLVQRR